MIKQTILGITSTKDITEVIILKIHIKICGSFVWLVIRKAKSMFINYNKVKALS